MDDITFCLSDCQRKDCFRHPSNIQDRTIPHSYADFKETETCPEFAKDINVPTNDDTISRKSVIDAVHTATYGFICGAEDGDEMTDEDKLVLSINKAVCNSIKALPSIQPEEVARDIATIIENEKDMRVILNAPSAQSEIIRCKDCMHNGSFDTDCPIDWNGKEYCSFAERKEDE